MNEQEFAENIGKEQFKQYLKNRIENNPCLTREQKEFQKQRVDMAAWQADQIQETMEFLHSIGLI